MAHFFRRSAPRDCAAGPRLLPYLFGQFFLRFPYYSLSMLRAGRLTGPPAYLRGLIAGARYLANGRITKGPGLRQRRTQYRFS
jgi:hypothetical protein